MRLNDLTGQRFGRLTVIARAPNRGRRTMWLCECDCGNQREIMADNLALGRSNSCGCLNAEMIVERSRTHGGSKTRLYNIWNKMRARCYDPKEKNYHSYGERGIKVCDEWRHDFESFRRWALANGYDETAKREGCTIDRINNDGDYCPDNCRWATFIMQANNKRSNHYLTCDGKTMTIAEWAREIGLNYGTLLSRVNKYHQSVEEALNPNTRAYRKGELKNEHSNYYRQNNIGY